MNAFDVAAIILIFATDVWVLIDANILGIKKTSETKESAKSFRIASMNMGAAGWFCGCLLLWIVFFPLYLVQRGKHLAQIRNQNLQNDGNLVVNCPSCKWAISVTPNLFGQLIACPTCRAEFVAPQPSRQSWYRGTAPTAIGYVVFAAFVACIVLGVFGSLVGGGMTKEQLESEVRKSIQETFLKSADTKDVQVESFNLVHESGNKYKGMLAAKAAGNTETLEVDVTYDGRTFMWKVLPQTIPATAPAVADAAPAQDSPEVQASEQRACINNLRLIDGAKQQWALENRKRSTDTPTMKDLRPYLGHGPNGDLPVCPAGGVYKIGPVSDPPTCSIPGHVLSLTPEPASASAQPEAVQSDWNKQETDAMKNGNIPFGIRTILANPALRSKAKNQDPQMVAKTPWNYYGQVVKLTGQVAVVQDFPQGSDFGQMLGGHDASDIVIASQDGTIVELFCMKPSGKMRIGDRVNLYGYPTGVTEVPNRVGGNDVHLILVGNDYDDFGAR